MSEVFARVRRIWGLILFILGLFLLCSVVISCSPTKPTELPEEDPNNYARVENLDHTKRPDLMPWTNAAWPIIAECVGAKTNSIRQFLIEVKPEGGFDCGSVRAWGCTYLDHIRVTEWDHSWGGMPRIYEGAVEHEFIHLALRRSGQDADYWHRGTVWSKCNTNVVSADVRAAILSRPHRLNEVW